MVNLKTRIGMSRQVLAGWDANPPGGNIEDLLRMISAEVDALTTIATEHPNEPSIPTLIAGYRDLASRLRAKAH